jgi:hypothetical protein
MKDSVTRTVNRKEFDRYMTDTKEGIHSIYGLEYNIDDSNGFINVTSFFTGNEPKSEFNTTHDLRKGNIPFTPTKKSNSLPFDFSSRIPVAISNDAHREQTILNHNLYKPPSNSMPYTKKRGQPKLGMFIS